MESFNELDCICNVLENTYDTEDDFLFEAFDVKNMKDRFKNGARNIGNAIVNAANRVIEFLKNIWTKIREWFKKLKARFSKRKSFQEYVDEKINEHENSKEEKTNFNAKKNMSDAERKYRDEASEKRKRNVDRNVKLKEVLYHASDKKIKLKKMLPYNELQTRANNIMREIIKYIELHDKDLEKDNDNIPDIFTYLDKSGQVKGVGLDAVSKTILEGAGVEIETTIGECIKTVQSYNSLREIESYVESYEKAIDKTFNRVLKTLKSDISENGVYNEKEVPDLYKQVVANINNLQKSMAVCTQITQKILTTLDSQLGACFKIVEIATNVYINEELK